MSSVSQIAQQKVNQSLAELTNPLVGEQLFAVANLLEGEKSLRRHLSDSGAPVAQRQAVAAQLLGNQISAETHEVIKTVLAQRWSNAADLIAGIEQAGALVIFAAAQAQGVIDVVEEEIFYFARLVDGEPQLQMALSDSASSASVKAKLVTDLLSGRANAATVSVLVQFTSHRRGRRVGSALDELSGLAAARRGLIVATVTSAIELSQDQKTRIGSALAKIYKREILVDVSIDAQVIGGISVNVAGEVIDGTISSRLEQARRQLLA